MVDVDIQDGAGKIHALKFVWLTGTPDWPHLSFVCFGKVFDRNDPEKKVVLDFQVTGPVGWFETRSCQEVPRLLRTSEITHSWSPGEIRDKFMQFDSEKDEIFYFLFDLEVFPRVSRRCTETVI